MFVPLHKFDFKALMPEAKKVDPEEEAWLERWREAKRLKKLTPEPRPQKKYPRKPYRTEGKKRQARAKRWLSRPSWLK